MAGSGTRRREAGRGIMCMQTVRKGVVGHGERRRNKTKCRYRRIMKNTCNHDRVIKGMEAYPVVVNALGAAGRCIVRLDRRDSVGGRLCCHITARHRGRRVGGCNTRRTRLWTRAGKNRQQREGNNKRQNQQESSVMSGIYLHVNLNVTAFLHAFVVSILSSYPISSILVNKLMIPAIPAARRGTWGGHTGRRRYG